MICLCGGYAKSPTNLQNFIEPGRLATANGHVCRVLELIETRTLGHAYVVSLIDQPDTRLIFQDHEVRELSPMEQLAYGAESKAEPKQD